MNIGEGPTSLSYNTVKENCMNEYITVNGDTIKLRPISSKVRDALAAKYLPPAKPTYTITNVSGDAETHEHDESTLETDQDKAAWEQYKKDLEKAGLVYSEIVVQTYVKFGTNYKEFVPADNTGWAELQEEMGVVVPKEPNARQMHYFLTEILTSDSDLRNIMADVRALSSEGRMLSIKEAEESFRSAVEGRAHNIAGRDAGTAVETSQGTEVGSGTVGP